MREYGQFSAVAKALDVVGDRWTLLIVRELSIRPCRYTDIRDGLPGIATNLLAERLRALETAGVISAEAAPPPVATNLYRLTERGEALLPAVAALGVWGAPLLADADDTDEFRPRWLVPAVRAMFLGVDVAEISPLTVGLDVDGEPLTLAADDGRVRVELGAPTDPEVRIACDGRTAVAVLSGELELSDAARRRRARIDGTREARARFARLVHAGRARRRP